MLVQSRLPFLSLKRSPTLLKGASSSSSSSRFRFQSTKIYNCFSGCCVGNKPNRFLHAILCLENLSSGLNRAGCALRVGFPSGAVFCKAHHHSAAAFTKKAKNRQERERIISKNSRPKKKANNKIFFGSNNTRERERSQQTTPHVSPNERRKKQTNKQTRGSSSRGAP